MYLRVHGNLAPIPIGFLPGGIWVMGYCGCMGYGLHLSANQFGGPEKLWSMGYLGYGQYFTLPHQSDRSPMSPIGVR